MDPVIDYGTIPDDTLVLILSDVRGVKGLVQRMDSPHGGKDQYLGFIRNKTLKPR